MSEKMTRIKLQGRKGGEYGLLEWGEETHENMVRKIKEHARHEFDVAQAILNADPVEFEVDIVRGPIVQHHIRKVLP